MSGVRLDREALLALIPHDGVMCLLDSVLEFGSEHIVCETFTHRSAANPLRREDRLSSVHLAEYAAQAMAAHGALQADGRSQPGMLAALRDIRLHVAFVDDIRSALIVRARRLLARSEGTLYEFRVTADERLLCEGRLAIALLRRAG